MLAPLVEAWLSPVVSVFAVPQLYPYPADKPPEMADVAALKMFARDASQPAAEEFEVPAFIPKFTEWVLEMVLLTLLKLERVSDSLWVESSLVPSLNW